MSSVLHPQFPSRLRGEADHRIANSLAAIGGLVRMMASKRYAVDPQSYLLQIADRIDTVAKLHRLVAHSADATVEISQYLQEICEGMSSALASPAIALSIARTSEHIVPFNVALPLGLLTAELVSNSLKYAHPAGLPVKITVTFSRAQPGGLMIAYEDDGVGFPEGFDIAHDGHFGMRLIRSLSKQLKATHEWLSDPLGIRFEITLPTTV
jgi:two-component sensor histidine kinase